MKILVFLLSFLLTFSTFAKESLREDSKPLNKKIETIGCSHKVRQLNLIKTLKDSIEYEYNFPRPQTDTKYDENYFPAAGKLILPNGGFGSGGFVGFKDSNGKILRNKMVTNAHNFFDDNGQLRFNLDTYEFRIGNDVSNPDAIFKIKKIECLGFGDLKISPHKDFCMVTTNKPLPSNIDPAVPWDQRYNSIEDAIDNADKFFTATYHSYWKGEENKRFYNICKKMDLCNHTNKFIDSDCNNSKGASGGLAFASIKKDDGSYVDTFIGLNTAINRDNDYNTVAPYMGQNSFSKKLIVVTRKNEKKYMNNIDSN